MLRLSDQENIIEDRKCNMKPIYDPMYKPFPVVAEARPSQIPNAGLGVFACRDIAPGEIVTEYGGLVIDNLTAKQNPDYPDTHLRALNKGYDAIDGRSGPPPLMSLKYFTDNNLLGSLINDSYGSTFAYNCKYSRPSKNFGCVHPNGQTISNRVVIKATQPIKAGEELFVNYGTSYHRRHFEPPPSSASPKGSPVGSPIKRSPVGSPTKRTTRNSRM